MKVLVTGAAGFLGRRLIASLLADPGRVGRLTHVVAADLVPCPVADSRVESRIGTIADRHFIDAIVDDDVAVVCHLAAVLSGQSEAEFDLGMRVNIEGTYGLLETCRRLAHPPRVVFSSTTAVFGGPLPPLVPEDMALLPQSSYGAEKAIAEHLVVEYSRRGFVDGVVCRVPTVAVRPGAPNSAVSSFVSGIIREPLSGVESVCPVPLDMRLWITSPDVVIANLEHAVSLPASALGRPAHREPAGAERVVSRDARQPRAARWRRGQSPRAMRDRPADCADRRHVARGDRRQPIAGARVRRGIATSTRVVQQYIAQSHSTQ